MGRAFEAASSRSEPNCTVTSAHLVRMDSQRIITVIFDIHCGIRELLLSFGEIDITSGPGSTLARWC